MRKAQHILRVLLFVGLAAAGGLSCVPLDQPLTDETNSTPDPSLIGHWICTNNEDVSKSWFVGKKPRADRALEMITAFINEETHEIQVDRYDLFTTTIDGMHVGTMRLVRGNDKFIALMMYDKPNADTVTVYMSEDNVWRNAIRANQLKGTLRDDSTELITDTPENIRAFIRSHGRAAFDTKDRFLTFKRARK